MNMIDVIRRRMMMGGKYVLTSDMGAVEAGVLETIYNQGGCKCIDKATAKELSEFDGEINYTLRDGGPSNHDYSWVQYFTSKCSLTSISTYGNTGCFVIVGQHLFKGRLLAGSYRGYSGISFRRIVGGNAIFLFDVPIIDGFHEYYFTMEWSNVNIYVPDEYYDNWVAELAMHQEGGEFYKAYSPLTGVVIRKLSECPEELKSKIKIPY